MSLLNIDGAALAYTERKRSDGFAVNASHARNGALRIALAKCGEDVDLFVSGKNIHGAIPCGCGRPWSDAGTSEHFALYEPEGSLARGPFLGF
jgi:hypothetical protein